MCGFARGAAIIAPQRFREARHGAIAFRQGKRAAGIE